MTTLDSLQPIVACHQPNFFPWLGYFHKIRWSDTFVLLDDVPIQRRSGTVTNRVAFAQNGKQLYMTAPITRADGGAVQTINEVELAPGDFKERFVSFLKHNYAKAAGAPELLAEMIALVQNPATKLSDYNEAAIRKIADILELKTPIVKSSTLPIETASTQRLIDIVKAVGGKTYLSGAGAGGYQENEAYGTSGLNLCLQSFTNTEYPRGKEAPFPGLSIVDALLHLGAKQTRALIDQPLDLSAAVTASS